MPTSCRRRSRSGERAVRDAPADVQEDLDARDDGRGAQERRAPREHLPVRVIRAHYGMCLRCAFRIASRSASRAMTKIAARTMITRTESKIRYRSFPRSLAPPLKMEP